MNFFIFLLKSLCCFVFVLSSLQAAEIKESKWENGQTLLTFFEKNSIPLNVYYDLEREDKELADEIISGNTFYTLYDGETLLQALIPIDENSQLHIYKQGDSYGMRAIPIIYFQKERTIALSVESSLYNDIVKYTGDTLLASDFIQAYKGSINFKRQIKKGDKLAIIYERKYRLGKVFGSPLIKASTLETSDEQKYVVRYEDGHFYDLQGNNLNKYLFMIPLNYKRISSSFSIFVSSFNSGSSIFSIEVFSKRDESKSFNRFLNINDEFKGFVFCFAKKIFSAILFSERNFSIFFFFSVSSILIL